MKLFSRIRISVVLSVVFAISTSAYAEENYTDLKPLNADALLLKSSIDVDLERYRKVLTLLESMKEIGRTVKDNKTIEKQTANLSGWMEEKTILENKIRSSIKEYNSKIAEK